MGCCALLSLSAKLRPRETPSQLDASDMWHGAPFPQEARLPGPNPKRTSYGSFFAFKDPDGNAWLVQEVTIRRPGRA